VHYTAPGLGAAALHPWKHESELGHFKKAIASGMLQIRNNMMCHEALSITQLHSENEHKN
jgi:hypothetical protein